MRMFGGLTPVFVSWLAHVDRMGPAHYVAAVSVVGLGCNADGTEASVGDVETTAHLDVSRV